MKNYLLIAICFLFSNTIFSQQLLDQMEVGAGGSQLAIYDPLGPSYNPKGQSFTAGITGLLSRIDIETKVASSCDSFRLSVFQGTNQFGSFMHSQVVSIGDFASQAYYQINLTTPPAIFAGNTYAFYIDTISCGPNLIEAVIISNSIGAYAGGNMFDQAGNPQSTFDMNFKTYVTCNISTYFGDGADPICFGDSTGYILLGVNSDNPPTTFLWNYQSITTQNIYNLPGGPYSCTVSDSKGCSAVYTKTMTIPVAISFSASSSDVTCHSFNDGTASMSIPTGGTGALTPFWSNGGSGLGVANLPPGQIIAYVTDGLGCLDSSTLFVNTPGLVNINFTPFQSTCGLNNGSIVANITGGTLPYDMYWSTGDTVNTIINLAAGFYQLEMIDGNGCYYSDVEALSDANGPSISLNTMTPILCANTNSGAINIDILGGTLPYSIVWSNNETTEDLFGLSGGNYDVSVQDAAGCFASVSFLMSEPLPIVFNPTSTLSSCALSDGSATITPAGGTLPYSISWDVNAGSQTTYTATALPSGLYQVILTDAMGCKDSVTVAVSDWNGPYIQVDSIKNAGCVNGNLGNGEIYLTTFGAGGFNFLWNDGAVTEDVIGLGKGLHSVLVTDGLGCKASHVEYLYGIVPGTPQICMTTVDTATNHNVIVWEKNVTGILNYKIYREGNLPGSFNYIATILSDSLSQFEDTLANSDVKSWKYELRATDSCGKVSTFSLTHKPIHLTATLGLTSDVILNWDQYQGFAYNQYYIFRDHFTTGWQLIDSTLNGVTNYTDFTAPAPIDSCRYLIEVYPASPCVSTRGVINTTRSNIKTPSSRVNGINNGSTKEDNSWTLFPNPNTGEFRIRLNEKTINTSKVIVLDNLGRVVYTKNLAAGIITESISVNYLDAGVYFVKLELNNKVEVKRVIISK